MELCADTIFFWVQLPTWLQYLGYLKASNQQPCIAVMMTQVVVILDMKRLSTSYSKKLTECTCLEMWNSTVESVPSAMLLNHQLQYVHPWPVTPIGKPWQMIAVDILEVPISSNNNRYLLVVQDYFTKWVEAVPMSDQTATKIVSAITKIFCSFGIPEVLHSDQGCNLRVYY